MTTNMILVDIGKIDKKFELLNNKLEDLANLQCKIKDDPFFRAGNCAEIGTIRRDIELLLRKELIKDIEVIKYTGGPHFGRLRQKRNQALLKYLHISKDMGDEIWKNQEETASDQNQLPKPLIEQLQAGARFHQMGPVQERHQQIKHIERSFEELGQMNNDLYELVGTQEAGVRFIEQKGEEVVQTMESSNAKLEKSTQSARSRRSIKRWSWLISVLIILVIIVVIAVVIYNQLRK